MLFVYAPWLCGYRPVTKQPRDGVQTALLVKKFVNSAPSRPIRSMLGVSMSVPP
ncbi:hypothetical protein LCGC14_1706420 [marine sediment metagenome]|uniref:Uncharacterized protein n=1 Tax=marine sediment metagenome TaxID=412755 RepID=A0A0F9I438_9ZZZZ